MATATKAQRLKYDHGGRFNDFPMVASDKIWKDSAVGIVDASGHARPLTSVDTFVGFAEETFDNSSGAAAAINVRVIRKGRVKLAITGAVITDIVNELPVYATDDTTFSFSPVGGVFIGRAVRWDSSGYVIVEFGPDIRDPWEGWVHELKADNYTVDAEDIGKMLWIATDAKTFTLPATVIGYGPIGFGNLGAYGTVAVNISPNANDKIFGADTAGTDNKDQINTKATANRGDYMILNADGSAGWAIQAKVGTWAEEA